MIIETNNYCCRKVFRANLDDVENLSYGRGAKKQRGTGSRFTCHRLNRDERRIFDQAKRDGFLIVRGTGYRKNRKGSPVANTFRQRCDALATLCVLIERRSSHDRIAIDVSTLRVPDDSTAVSFLLDTVFRSKHPDIYEALVSKDCRVGSSTLEGESVSTSETERYTTSLVVENTTRRAIDWEMVRSKPIWGVDQRLLAVTCDREVAKSIAIDVLEANKSPQFAVLLAESERTAQQRAERTFIEARINTEPPMQTAGTTKPGTSTICGDKNDITAVVEVVSSDCSDNDDDIDCIDWNDI
jgi:hypothetical protein